MRKSNPRFAGWNEPYFDPDVMDALHEHYVHKLYGNPGPLFKARDYIKVWPFNDAPEELKKFSPFGGNWVAFIPNTCDSYVNWTESYAKFGSYIINITLLDGIVKIGKDEEEDENKEEFLSTEISGANLSSWEDHIKVWPFYKAPIHLRSLSRHSGDEDWIVFIPKALLSEFPNIEWAEAPNLSCYRVDKCTLLDGQIRIGAHS